MAFASQHKHSSHQRIEINAQHQCPSPALTTTTTTTSSAALSQIQPTQCPIQHLVRGLDALQQGRFEQCRLELQNAIAVNRVHLCQLSLPYLLELHYNYAWCLYYEGMYNDAYGYIQNVYDIGHYMWHALRKCELYNNPKAPTYICLRYDCPFSKSDSSHPFTEIEDFNTMEKSTLGTTTKEILEWLELYLYGFQLFSVLLSFLLLQSLSLPNNGISVNTSSLDIPEKQIHQKQIHPYRIYLKAVCRWDTTIRSRCRDAFFVLYSYSKMLGSLRTKSPVPTSQVIRRFHHHQKHPDTLPVESSAAVSAAKANKNAFVKFGKLFVFGESHTIPFAWQFCSINSKIFQFHPILVAGLKAFHFSSLHVASTPQSNSVRKHSRKIPLHSAILSVCGEIDCRISSGIVEAVKKGKYGSEDEAIQRTAMAYLRGLVRIAFERHCTIFIIPVRPAVLPQMKVKKGLNLYKRNNKVNLMNQNNLADKIESSYCSVIVNPTPPISMQKSDLHSVQSVYRYALLVRDFNRALKSLIEGVSSYANLLQLYNEIVETDGIDGYGADLCNCADYFPSIHWLDAFDPFCEKYHGQPLCSNDPTDYLLHPRFNLEGMHVNLQYVRAIEPILQKYVDCLPPYVLEHAYCK